MVSRRGGVGYNELKALNVKEFFVTLVNCEAEIADEIKANEKAINKQKGKK